jgi:hypothetical protein
LLYIKVKRISTFVKGFFSMENISQNGADDSKPRSAGNGRFRLSPPTGELHHLSPQARIIDAVSGER